MILMSSCFGLKLFTDAWIQMQSSNYPMKSIHCLVESCITRTGREFSNQSIYKVAQCYRRESQSMVQYLSSYGKRVIIPLIPKPWSPFWALLYHCILCKKGDFCYTLGSRRLVWTQAYEQKMRCQCRLQLICLSRAIRIFGKRIRWYVEVQDNGDYGKRQPIIAFVACTNMAQMLTM